MRLLRVLPGFLLLLTSCRDATAPIEVVGTYELNLIDGRSLPHSLPWSAPDEEPPYVASGQLNITDNWLFISERIERRVVDANGDTLVLNGEEGLGGEYTRTGNQVVMTHRSAATGNIVSTHTFWITRAGVLQSEGHFYAGSFVRMYCRSDAC